jgi:hypothetical protein
MMIYRKKKHVLGAKGKEQEKNRKAENRNNRNTKLKGKTEKTNCKAMIKAI